MIRERISLTSHAICKDLLQQLFITYYEISHGCIGMVGVQEGMSEGEVHAGCWLSGGQAFNNVIWLIAQSLTIIF